MQQRPVYLDLTKIRLPLSAIISIMHRVSGIYVFFVTIPLTLYCMYKSTFSKASFDQLVIDISSISLFSFFVFISISIFLFHIMSGIRHLIMDFLHIGESLNGAHYSAISTLIFWFVISMVFCGYLFL